MSSNISIWYEQVLAQFAAESYLYGFINSANIDVRLTQGANNPDSPNLIPPDQRSATEMTQVMLDDFNDTWEIIDQLPNTTSGFSATVLKHWITGEFTLSFRSTESRDEQFGGDNQRDGLNCANGQISNSAFAFGQIEDMEAYYAHLKNGERWDASTASWVVDPRLDEHKAHLQGAGQINLTGYSLGGHLAQVFTRLHYDDVKHTYTMNGAGFVSSSGTPLVY